jgi:protocatechuate 3,4-dioxygenase alpha subunit
MTDGITPSQTVGPYFAYCLTPQDYDFPAVFSADLTSPSTGGQRIVIEGRVTDGDGLPITDAMLEIWQADPEGRYAHPADGRARGNTGFAGFGRVATNADGVFRFTTVKPGPVPGPGGRAQAPHIAVNLFARGMLRHVVTRIYFPDEPATAEDAVLALVPPDRRDTLVSRREDGPEGPLYRFDIRVQGERETVFFEA